MADTITLRNNDRASEHQVYAADGTSFQIQPGAVVSGVDAKFNWNLPPKVTLVNSGTIAVDVPNTNPATVENSGQTAKSARSTPSVSSLEAVIPNASLSTISGTSSGGNKNASN